LNDLETGSHRSVPGCGRRRPGRSGGVRDIIVGLVGAVIGGLILHAVRGGSHASPSVLIEIVVACVGAVILLIIAKAMDRKRV
jgi:uncharacterized membrane protein YeaQ/YmgE (transglycosylase-associated protein family)